MRNNILASIALFQSLYDNGKKDIFSVIAEFVKVTIHNNNLHSFDITKLRLSLKKDFEIELPESVLKTVLAKRLKDRITRAPIDDSYGNKQLLYNSIPSNFDVDQFNQNLKEQSTRYSYVFEKLIAYYKKNSPSKYINDDDILNGFINFLLKNSKEREECIYSKFILINESDVEFIDCLNEIKEGYIIINGIKDVESSTDVNSVNSWSSRLVIYLDTEHLFSYYGYNGQLFKETLTDFISLVNEANKKTKYIELRYFEETKNAVESFFGAAILIKDGKLRPYASPAMNSILERCDDAGDVLVEKGQFYSFLSSSDVKLDDRANYVTEMDGNLQTSDNIEKLLDDSSIKGYNFKEEDIAKYLRVFSIINSKRNLNNRTSFEKCRYILMTGNSIASYIAWHSAIKLESDFSFSSDIDFITSKLWFKLHKGLIKSKRPISFDTVSKTKLIIASLLYNSAFDKYTELQSKGYSKDDEICVFNAIREHEIYPEDINSDNIDEIINFINIRGVEDIRRERSFLTARLEEKEKDSIELKQLKFELRQEKKDKIRRIYRGQIWVKCFVSFLILLCFAYATAKLVGFIITPNDTNLSVTSFLISCFIYPCLTQIKPIRRKILKLMNDAKNKYFRRKIKLLNK